MELTSLFKYDLNVHLTVEMVFSFHVLAVFSFIFPAVSLVQILKNAAEPFCSQPVKPWHKPFVRTSLVALVLGLQPGQEPLPWLGLGRPRHAGQPWPGARGACRCAAFCTQRCVPSAPQSSWPPHLQTGLGLQQLRDLGNFCFLGMP